MQAFEVCFMWARAVCVRDETRPAVRLVPVATADRLQKSWRQDARTQPPSGKPTPVRHLTQEEGFSSSLLSLSHAAFISEEIFIICTAPTTYCSCKISFLCCPSLKHTHTVIPCPYGTVHVHLRSYGLIMVCPLSPRYLRCPIRFQKCACERP